MVLINEIANQIRMEILTYLQQSPASFTDISKQLNISNSEVSRHLNRLTEYKFVQKEIGSRRFELTPLGILVNTLFSPIDFVLRHVDYFQSHELSDLPISLIKDLDALRECTFIQGTGLIMIKLQEIIENAKHEFWVMTEQPFPFGKHGLDVKYLVTPKMAAYKPNIVNINKSTLARVLPKISISIALIDRKRGMIFFPDLQGSSDFNYGFYADENSIGLEYIIKVWHFFWEKGEVMDF